MTDAAFPPITVRVGESVFALAQRSSAFFSLEGMNDSTPVVVASPATVTVVVNDRPLPLPPTRYTQIEQVAGVVTGVDLAPMANFARLEPCNVLAAWMVKDAAAHGWTIAQQEPVDLEAMRAALQREGRPRFEWTYAELSRGDVTLRIYLKEAAQRPRDMVPPSSEPLFLVNTSFRNPKLRDAQDERLFARRKDITGGTASVPLSVWRPR